MLPRPPSVRTISGFLGSGQRRSQMEEEESMGDLPEDDTLFLEAAWLRFAARMCHDRIFKDVRNADDGNQYALYFGGTWNIASNGMCNLNLTGEDTQSFEGLQHFFRTLNERFEGIPWLVLFPPPPRRFL